MILYEYEVLRDMGTIGIPVGLIQPLAAKGWRVVAVLALSDPKAPGNVEVLLERPLPGGTPIDMKILPDSAKKKDK